GGEVFIGGSFGMLQGMVNGFHLARFMGMPDAFEPIAYFNGSVNALAADPFISDAIGVYAGGEFTQNVVDSVPYLAETILFSSVDPLPTIPGMALSPNPAHDKITVSLDAPYGDLSLEVVDAQVRTVLTRSIHGGPLTLEINQLATGSYT